MNVKFSTKFVAASAAAVMALSLAGCSGGSMDDSSSSSAKASGDSITIGTVTTNSGTAAAYGEAEVKGFELAVSEINAKGGINGKKVKLESMDDKGDATEASNAYNKLAGDNNVLAVAGPTISADRTRPGHRHETAAARRAGRRHEPHRNRGSAALYQHDPRPFRYRHPAHRT